MTQLKKITCWVFGIAAGLFLGYLSLCGWLWFIHLALTNRGM